jgi:hypothetical protein
VELAFALAGRTVASGAYYICLQYASEIFPTSLPGKGVASCEVIGGIGMFIGPWIVYLVRIIFNTKAIILNLQKDIVKVIKEEL